MRLIDADALIKFMEDKCDMSAELDPIILAVCKGAINEQPTVTGTIIGNGEYPYYRGVKEGKQLGYNKVIDEFAEKFIYKAVCEGCSGCCDCYENEYQMACGDWKYYMGIAEQMKVGVKNE